MTILRGIAYSLVLVSLVVWQVHADDFSWSNGSGGTWTTASNWTQTPVDNGDIPGATDNVISPSATGFIQIDPAAVTVLNWAYSNSGSQLVVGNSGATTLNVTDTMTLTSGSQTFRNSGASTLAINVGHVDVTGSTTSGQQFGAWNNSQIESFIADSMNISGGFASFKVGASSGTATINNSLTLSGSGAAEVRWTNTGGQSGTLAVGGLISASSSSAIRVHHGSTATIGTLQLNNGSGTTTSFAGILEDGGSGGNILSVEKNNAGTQIFSGNSNTYSGTTTVNGGTLLINNTSGSGTGASTVSVNNGGRLGGSGSATGDVTIAAGGSILGGDGLTAGDDLALSGALMMMDDSVIELTLGGGGAHSFLSRTGGVWSFDTDQSFLFLDAGAEAGLYDNLITGLTGSETGLASVGSWTVLNSGWVGTFNYDGAGSVDLSLTAVPEPSTSVAFLASGALMFVLRRRSHA